MNDLSNALRLKLLRFGLTSLVRYAALKMPRGLPRGVSLDIGGAMRRSTFIMVLIILVISSSASALNSFTDGQGYLKCWNTRYMNPPQIARWHSSITEVKVYINWNSFYNNGFTVSQRVQLQASISYIVRQWLMNFIKNRQSFLRAKLRIPNLLQAK